MVKRVINVEVEGRSLQLNGTLIGVHGDRSFYLRVQPSGTDARITWAVVAGEPPAGAQWSPVESAPPVVNKPSVELPPPLNEGMAESMDEEALQRMRESESAQRQGQPPREPPDHPPDEGGRVYSDEPIGH